MNTANNSCRSGRRFGTLLDPRRLFDDLMTWEPVGSEVVWSEFAEPLNVDNTNDGVTISIDLPGVEASDLDLTFEAGTLAIAGKRGDRTYSYSVALDDTIDPSTIDPRSTPSSTGCARTSGAQARGGQATQDRGQRRVEPSARRRSNQVADEAAPHRGA
jgi:HSP20 family molecular chaperone IbpA